MSQNTTNPIIITGASSGIGLATVNQLLAQQYRIIGIARDFSRSAIVADNAADNFTPLSIDLSETDHLPERFASIAKEYPDIGGIICCAGLGRFGCLETFSYQQIKELMDVNFTSHCYLVKALLPTLKKSKQGDIIFMGSESAINGGKQGAIYCASKFALRGFAQSLRQECAKSNVRITVINPGMVKTPFFETLHFEPGCEPENAIEADDVADAILLALQMRGTTVIDEINLSPLKKVITNKPRK